MHRWFVNPCMAIYHRYFSFLRFKWFVVHKTYIKMSFEIFFNSFVFPCLWSLSGCYSKLQGKGKLFFKKEKRITDIFKQNPTVFYIKVWSNTDLHTGLTRAVLPKKRQSKQKLLKSTSVEGTLSFACDITGTHTLAISVTAWQKGKSFFILPLVVVWLPSVGRLILYSREVTYPVTSEIIWSLQCHNLCLKKISSTVKKL